jgi:hypothetical protein
VGPVRDRGWLGGTYHLLLYRCAYYSVDTSRKMRLNLEKDSEKKVFIHFFNHKLLRSKTPSLDSDVIKNEILKLDQYEQLRQIQDVSISHQITITFFLRKHKKQNSLSAMALQFLMKLIFFMTFLYKRTDHMLIFFVHLSKIVEKIYQEFPIS